MIDKQVLRRFKQFQKKTGKYEDFKLEKVEFEGEYLGNSLKIIFNPAKSDKFDTLVAKDASVSFVPMANVDEVNGVIRHYDSRNIKSLLSGSYRHFENGDILFAKVTPCMENGNCAIVDNLENGVGFGSSEFYVFRGGAEINNKYIHFFLRQDHLRQDAKKTFTGSGGLKRVPKSFFDDTIISIPKSQNDVYTSLKIQDILVEFIEFYQHNTREKLGIIDQITDKIAAAESLLLPLFFLKHPSVSRRFDAFCKAKKIELKLKDLKFENRKLSELALLTMGQSPEGTDINDSGKGLPFHQGKTGYGEMYLKEATNWTEVGRKIAEKDDILISMRAPAGAINIASYTTAIGRGLASIRCNADISRTYLYFYLKDNERRIENAGENGGIFTSINRDYLVDFAINVPVQLNENFTSHYLQQLIVEFIESYFSKMSERKDLTASLKALFSTRNNMIIQKTFKTKDKK